MGGPNSGKMRKPGEWIAVARGRANKVREPQPNKSEACIPSVTDTGSAAYRRLLRKRSDPTGRRKAA